MKGIVGLIAGVWMVVAGLQGLSFLARYGILPLPPGFGRLDFTPAYTPLMALVLLGALLARTRLGAVASAPERDGTRERRA